MGELLAGGRLVDAIILLTLLEGLVLVLFHARTGRGPSPRNLVPNLLAGLFLLLALRAALADAGTPLILTTLGLAFLAHLADLRARWRRGSNGG